MRKDWIEIELGKVLWQSKEKHRPEKVEKLFYVGLEHIEKNSGELTEDVGEEEINTVKNKFEKGQILYGKLRPYLNKAHLAKKTGVCSTDILVFEVSNVVLPEYAVQYTLSRKFVNDMSANTSGVNLPRVPTKYINEYPFPLAPLPEQRAIVAKIEQLFSELDNGISNLKAAKDKLEIYRQAVLKKAFEGELTKEWREQQTNLPTAEELLEQIKAERLNHYESQIAEWEEAVAKWEANGKQGNKPSKPRKPKFSEDIKLEEAKVDKIPATWCLTEIQNISDLVTDGTHHTPVYTDTGVKFISVKDIYNEIVHFDNCKYISEEAHSELIKRCHPQKGDLLITKSGTIGRLAIVPDEEFSLFVSVALIKLQSAEKYLHPKWIYYSVKFHVAGLNVAQDIKGGLLKNYHLEDLRVAKVILAPFEEQERVIEEIETRLSVCDNILANIEEGLEKSEALRQSILKQAFEGKLLSEEELEACKKEPDWEPAEKLLERIKSEKETSGKKKKAPAKKTSRRKIHHVEYYKRTLLAAEIVWQLHQQPTLGHLKLQKLIYLCQESGNMQLPTNFLQQAAGPYDPQMARSIDKQLKTKNWFAYQKDELLKYAPLEKAGGHQADFNKYYANDIDNIQKVINLFRTAKSDQIEIVATLYACWKKIIQEKAVFSENLLIKRFYEWSEEKSKYSESRVKKAMEWMQEKGVVPDKEQFLLKDNTSHA